MDYQSAAAMLYGEKAPAEKPATLLEGAPATPNPAPDPAPADAPLPDPEQALYGQPKEAEIRIPDNIKAEREADPGRKLYDPAQTFRETINHEALFSSPDVAAQFSPEMQRAVVKEMANMAADVGMDNNDARAFKAVLGSVAEPPSDATRAQWRQQAQQRLVATYGADAGQALADAVRLVRADPRRAQMLDHNGVGDHPDTVMMFARLARAARAQGKFK